MGCQAGNIYELARQWSNTTAHWNTCCLFTVWGPSSSPTASLSFCFPAGPREQSSYFLGHPEHRTQWKPPVCLLHAEGLPGRQKWSDPGDALLVGQLPCSLRPGFALLQKHTEACWCGRCLSMMFENWLLPANHCMCWKAHRVGFSDRQSLACGTESSLSKVLRKAWLEAGLLQGVSWPDLLCLSLRPVVPSSMYRSKMLICSASWKVVARAVWSGRPFEWREPWARCPGTLLPLCWGRWPAATMHNATSRGLS